MTAVENFTTYYFTGTSTLNCISTRYTLSNERHHFYASLHVSLCVITVVTIPNLNLFIASHRCVVHFTTYYFTAEYGLRLLTVWAVTPRVAGNITVVTHCL